MNYYDFAENDYQFIIKNYENGGVWNSMCSISQKVCERFLKHLIDQYYIPESDADEIESSDVMKTHSLYKLERFLRRKMNISISDELHNALTNVNGFYFETSYPGDESYFVDSQDVETAVNAMNICKDFVNQYIKEQQIEEDREDV